MKSSGAVLFLKNLILYSAVAMLLYYLYSPLNKNPNNKERSSTQFIYQQF